MFSTTPIVQGTSTARRTGAAGRAHVGQAAGTLLRAAARVETGYALLLVSAFVLPHWIGYRAWIPALALAIALAVGHGLLASRRPILPVALAAYFVVYAVVAVHSDPDTFSVIEAGKFFAPPALALAVAWSAHDPAIRQRLVLLSIAAVALQVPVVLAQAVDNLADFGRDAIEGVDSITGLLGPDHPGTVAQSGLFAGFVVLAAGFVWLLRLRWAVAAALVLIFLTVLTSTRAGYLFAPVGLGAIAIALWLAGRREAVRANVRLLTLLAVLILPVLVITQGALYPGANTPVTSFDSLTSYLKGSLDESAYTARPGGAGSGGGARIGSRAEAGGGGGARGKGRPGVQGVRGSPCWRKTCLPGRGRQLSLALELSVEDSVDVALLGRGIGASRFKDQSLLSPTGATADPISREEQRTNGVWVPRVITETGFLGLLAFGSLIAYMIALAWRNRLQLRSSTWDGAVILALPGIAALTLASAFYNTVLAIQPYATLFWPLLGVAIAIDAERRDRERRGSVATDRQKSREITSSAMAKAKATAKRSKWLVIGATIAKDLHTRWTARRGAAPSTCGSTHAPLSVAESLAYIDSVFQDYLTYGGLSCQDLRGMRVLELGPGDNCGVALRFLACGAERLVCLDKFVTRRDETQQRRIYAALLGRMAPDARAALDEAIDLGGRVRFDERRLRHFEGVAVEEAAELLESAGFDLIVSRAVLEHVYDPDAAFEAMDELLAPGGLILHKVDFRDHGMFTGGGMHPLTFLTVPDTLYRWMARHSGRPNRRLADWYRGTLDVLGYDPRFRVTHVVGRSEEIVPHADRLALDPEHDRRTLEQVESIRPRLRPQFRGLSDTDLATAGVFIVARKPDPEAAPEREPTAAERAG